MTSLGAVQSAAEPSSGALAGMVAAEVRSVSSPPVSPSTSFQEGEKKNYDGEGGEEKR